MTTTQQRPNGGALNYANTKYLIENLQILYLVLAENSRADHSVVYVDIPISE